MIGRDIENEQEAILKASKKAIARLKEKTEPITNSRYPLKQNPGSEQPKSSNK